MRVTGNQLLTRIKELTELRNHYQTQFAQHLTKFESETGIDKDPDLIFTKYTEVERILARVLVAQEQYNQAVSITLDDDTTMSLAEAIKLMGASARAVALWKSAESAVRTHSIYSNMRNKDHEYAEAVVPADDVLHRVQKYQRVHRMFQEAIHKGNTYGKNVSAVTEVDFE